LKPANAPRWLPRGERLQGRLGRRILVWFLVLSLVPLFLSNTVGYLVTRRIMRSQVERYLGALANVQAQQVASEVERHQLRLDAAVASDPSLVRKLAAASAAVRAGRREAEAVAALHEVLDRKLERMGGLAELFVIDTTGTVVAATRHSRIGQDWSKTALFRQGRLGHFFAADWGVRNGRPVPLYRLAVPIPVGRTGLTGVLAGTVDFEVLRSFLNIPEHVAMDVHVFILDRLGRPLLVSHPHSRVEYSHPLATPLIDRPPGSSARYVNYEGVEVFGLSAAIPGVPWLYLSEVPVDSAFGQLKNLALLAAGLEILFALALVGIVWVVARSIVQPLRRLVGAADRIRGGELGVTVEIARDDELGELGRTFNQMSRELQSSARRIQELHDQEMRRAAQLASVGEMASGIAHEIKNPLVGVASGLDLLSKHLRGNSTAESILEQIRAQVRRMESAIHDLLSYARPKEPLFVLTDPGQILDRLLALVRPQAEAVGVRVELTRPETLPKVRVDPELLTQALVNLALNAIQAMEKGGVLGISVESVPDGVRFSISDTGKGIGPEQLDQVFRPFYTTKHQGTGLGLTITKGIVERHGGRLEVESRPGVGSTFSIVVAAETREAGSA
jgi:signal transduction histidine kinase